MFDRLDRRLTVKENGREGRALPADKSDMGRNIDRAEVGSVKDDAMVLRCRTQHKGDLPSGMETDSPDFNRSNQRLLKLHSIPSLFGSQRNERVHAHDHAIFLP